jgi:hypothetical protein
MTQPRAVISSHFSKLFAASVVAATTIVAVIAVSAVECTAQTSSGAVGSPGPTTPLGTNLGNFPPNQQTSAAGLPYSGTLAPAPCSTGQQGQSTQSAFDGGGINLSTNVPTNSTVQSQLPEAVLPGAFGIGTAVSPCNSVSSSGIASPATPVTATSSPSSSNSGSAPAAPTVTNTNIDGLGTSALGVGSLGSASQATSTPVLCPGPPIDQITTATSPTMSASGSTVPSNGTTASAASVGDVGDGGDVGAVVDNRTTQGPGTGPYSPAQGLAGGATQPMMRAAGAPCLTGGD